MSSFPMKSNFSHILDKNRAFTFYFVKIYRSWALDMKILHIIIIKDDNLRDFKFKFIKARYSRVFFKTMYKCFFRLQNTNNGQIFHIFILFELFTGIIVNFGTCSFLFPNRQFWVQQFSILKNWCKLSMILIVIVENQKWFQDRKLLVFLKPHLLPKTGQKLVFLHKK